MWEQLTNEIDLELHAPTVVLGTGQEQENLRAAVWLKGQYPNAQIYARTNDNSRFASDVGSEYGIVNISITQLLEQSIPEHWLA